MEKDYRPRSRVGRISCPDRQQPSPAHQSIRRAARRRVHSRILLCLSLLNITFLAAPAHAQTQTSFVGDWSNFGHSYTPDGAYTWIIGTQDNHWSYLQAKSANRIVTLDDPHSPTGGKVAQVTVKPGDNVGYTGERAEVSYMRGPGGVALPVTSQSGHEYYAISVKLAPNWQPPGKDYITHGSVWGIFLQLHSPNPYDSPPAIALTAESDFHLNMDTGDLLDGGTLKQYKANISYPFSNGALVLNKWVEFLLDIVWAENNTGSISVYRRDPGQRFECVLSLKHIPTLQTVYGIDPGKNYHYWKTGYYRSTTQNVTSKLWLGPLVRGTDLNTVVTAAFSKPN